MKDLARKMLAKCEGLPIAIVLLGGILSAKRKDIHVWADMLKMVRSNLTKSRVFRKILALSYNDLDYDRKSCFLYFGLFPEDSVIECDKLIRLWVAEGFLKQRDDEAMVDMARECLDDLIHRNMVQVAERKSNGDPQTCRTHDLIRALATQEAKKTKFSSISIEKIMGSVEGSRRIALHPKDIETFHCTSTAPLQSKAWSMGHAFSSLQISRRRPGVAEEVDHDHVVGFQKEADEVAFFLTKKEPLGQLAVVSIVGMGGVGKTTLARKVYNRSDVKSNFDCRAWVCVSLEFAVKDIFQTILQQVTTLSDADLEHKDDEELQWMIRNHLEEKNYLIVLDDLWRQEDWDVIERVFPKPLKRQKCRVLFTTRSLGIACYANPSNVYNLHVLDMENSMKLFLQAVSRCSQDEIPKASLSKEMTNIAREIIEVCKRLPLSISLVGGLLSVKRMDVSVWANVLASLEGPKGFESWHNKYDSIFPLLDLCFADSPEDLRYCLLYFRFFREEIEIDCDALIRLWAMEGFLKPRNNKTVEDVARDCLEELIQRNLIEIAKRRSDGAPEICRIHDLIRDLVQMKAKKAELSKDSENNELGLEEGNLKDSAHHGTSTAPPLSQPKTFSLMDDVLSFLDPVKFPNHVYSLLCFSKNPQFHFQQFPLLRVLDLQGAQNVEEVPNEIRNLTLLRYLSLRGTRVKVIPPWIANLRNLQTLDAPSSKIPIDTLKLDQLRHLFADSFSLPATNMWCADSSSSSPLLHIGVLKHLHTLELNIGDWIFRGLDELTNLRVLRLQGGDDNDLIWAIAKLKRLKVFSLTKAKASHPMHLPSLSDHLHLNEMVLEGPITKLPKPNDFPSCLTYLWLESHLGSMDPFLSFQKLPVLKKLCLVLFKGNHRGEMTCSEGGFPKLDYLYIRVDFKLKNWTVERGALPSLRVLHIEGDNSLGELPDGLGHVTTLKELIITKGYDVRDSLVAGGKEWGKVKDISPSIKFLVDSSMRP